MPIPHPDLHLTRLDGAIPAWLGEIKPGDLPPICQNVANGGGRLVATRQFAGERAAVKQQASQAALDMVRRTVTGES